MLAIVLTFLTLALTRLESPAPSYGPAPVGFRVITSSDPDRARPITIHVWYPAASSAAPMRIGEYLDALVPAPNADRAAFKREHVADLTTLMSRLYGPAPDGSIEAMLDAPMRATRDAPPAPARGRLIVSLLTPISTSITNEVLASHGFVVAAVQYRPVDGNSGTPLEREGRTTEVFRQDLGLAIDRMRQEPYVAPGPVGAFAFSGAGVPVVALAAANRDVGAMALFETGWHGSLGSSFAAVRDFSFSQIRSPFLFLVGADLDHADVQMRDIDAMSQSTRTIARTGAPGLSHWDFAAEGYLAAADPHWRAADRAAVRAIFEEANALAVAFFDQHLRSGPSTAPATPHFRLRSVAAGSSDSVAPRIDASPIAGMWKGTVTAGAQSSDIGIEIRQLANGTGFFLTLPPLHAWRMPVSYLTPTADDRWTIDDWQIAVRRDGERLVGQLGDPRVTFTATRTDTLPTEPAAVDHPTGPSPAWTYDAGAPLWAGLAAADDTIYAADAGGTVHAIHAQDGSNTWRARGDAPIYGSPIVTGDALIVFDDAGTVRRLARSDGHEVWRANLGGAATVRVLPAATVFDFDFHSPEPVVDAGVVYVTTAAGVVHALDARNGQVRWRRDLQARVRASVALSSTRVFVGTLDKDVVALDRRTGAEVWRTRMTGPVVSAPTVAGDVVIAGSRGAWLSGFDIATGRERWSRFQWISWVESAGALADGIYYLGSSDLRAVRAIEPATGRTIWETDVLGWAWGTPAVVGEHVYIGVAGPQKYVTKHAAGLVALERETGRIAWRRPVPVHPTNFVSGYPGSVVIAGDVLAAPDVAGSIEGYRVR